MGTRSLRLRRETLTELGAGSLLAVRAGTATENPTDVVTVLRTAHCPTGQLFSGIYPSVNVDCTRVLDEYPSLVC